MPAPARSNRWCSPNTARRISPTHVPELTRALRAKLDTLMEALAEQFGTAAEFEEPKGGIFLWVKLPDDVDTRKLAQAALAAGIAINPGFEWSPDKPYGKSRAAPVFRQSLPLTISATASPRLPTSAAGIRRAEPDRQCGEVRTVGLGDFAK